MARALEADSLRYLPLDAVARCINMPEASLCRACLTGQYPTPAGQELYGLDRLGAETGGGRLVELAMVRR